MGRILAILISVFLCVQPVWASPSMDEGPQITAPSAVLMEASTGQIIYEKDADEQLPPASVTKIMTLLLIFDALDSGQIQLDDKVTTSEYAASMGGSQVFLEAGETQTVDTLIKCISVASANDACVAMAEYICGNEEEFVARMNQRAKDLGMENTHFINCNGLDVDGHLTTARDIAVMSRELITEYPEIYDYCTIWMENITHTTKKGTSEFGLTNTNKLIRQYEYATGLKTGSTGKAKFCVSATARKDGMDLIAVIMAAPDSKTRMKDAVTLFNYGFGKCQRYEEKQIQPMEPVEVSRGKEKQVNVVQDGKFVYVDTTGADLSKVKRKAVYKEKIEAPVKKGEKIGVVQYYLDEKMIGSIDIIAEQSVEKISYKSAMGNALEEFLL
ncbi:MAG: D-alanyl-D-alanine carboxypeptidase [Dorea sp.]|nr:D-alanyl-D-alanine carboxypeptidase [Dorea sp.]MDY2812640.1 D-alanyl-D-alanine carboxypeptidase family protein [Dorea sp.]